MFLFFIYLREASISIEKIIRTSRDLLIQQAWGKYDPEMTVTKAKILRLWDDVLWRPKDAGIIPPIVIPKKIEELKPTIAIDSVSNDPQRNTFPVPDGLKKLRNYYEL